MCESQFIQYTCGCKKEMEFIQCEERRGTIVKCSRITKSKGKESMNYCSTHLVKPDAPEVCRNRNEETIAE